MNVGIIGCGNISETYFECKNLFNNFNIIACADINIEAAKISEEKYNVNEDSCSTHPHNTYIQILAEMGIIGFSVFLMIPIYLVSKIITHIYQYFRNGIRLLSDYQICLIGCFLLTLWPLAPTLSFFNNWISVVYYLPIGFFLSTIYSNKTH